MDLNNLIRITTKILRNNAPTILTAIGVTGTVTTAYLAAKASFKAAEVIRIDTINAPTPKDSKERLVKRTKLVWKFYIPAASSGAVTVACMIAATKIGNKKLAASIVAGAISEKALLDYKSKVVETLGGRKEQTIRDEIAQDRVNQQPPTSKEVVMMGNGTVLCHEAYTGRYFQSDMETLRHVENEINKKVLQDLYVTLSDFYHIIGLPRTSISSEYGWDSGRFMELLFSTVLAENNIPCLSFEYNYVKRID